MANCVIAYDPCFSCAEKKCEICELDMHRKRVFQQSEVEELKKAYANYEETTGLKKAKQEVAREIFEELARKSTYVFPTMLYTIAKRDVDELKKKYLEEQE